MTDRNTVIDFTRDAMDRLRELALVPELPCGLIRTLWGWEFVAPGVLYEFKIEPKTAHYSALLVSTRGAKGFMPAAYLRVLYQEVEALVFIGNYIRGV